MKPLQWPISSRVSKLSSLRTRWLKSPITYTARACGAQTRKIAPAAIRLAPIGVPGWM